MSTTKCPAFFNDAGYGFGRLVARNLPSYGSVQSAIKLITTSEVEDPQFEPDKVKIVQN